MGGRLLARPRHDGVAVVRLVRVRVRVRVRVG